MKVSGPGSAGPVNSGGGARRAAGTSFAPAHLDSAQASAAAARPGAAASLGSLDALIALQEAPGRAERRRRAIGRAGRMLDVLDQVKLAVLDGEAPHAALERLRGAVREERGGTEDPRLEGVLDEIETRAAVELAKQEMARAAA